MWSIDVVFLLFESLKGQRKANRSARAASINLIPLAFQLFASARSTAADMPPGFVQLSEIAPSIRQEIRYAGSYNFIGRPMPGYEAAQCWLRQEAALALAMAQTDALQQGLKLVVYDCYRPQRATKAFIKWAMDDTDQNAKDRFYPEIEKRTLFAQGYIGRQSSHSTGLAVDLAIDGLDFGTSFDFFDPRSSTNSRLITAAAAANRRTLRHLMLRRGFANYKREWWHYSHGMLR
jgi:zinc D-Ala-D-Ala dipeptidase